MKLPVAGHLPAKVTLEEAIEAGQASIEHFMGIERLGRSSARAAFAQAAKRGTRFTPR